MTDEAGFLQAILRTPDDAALRSVYADWLEERGDPRGEYLRCQCTRADLQRGDPRLAALLQREEELREQYPTVILPWQRRLLLARIKKILGELEHGFDGEKVNEWPHGYTSQPCLTEQELKAWEAASNVSLPEEYRLFLLEIGNGGNMPSEYCDFEVWPLGSAPMQATLLEPFPITKERLRQRSAEYDSDEASFLPELDECWENGDPPPGCLAVARYPSYDVVSLVVNGELRGSLWCGVAGWRPEFSRHGDPDFLTWFEDTLLDLR